MGVHAVFMNLSRKIGFTETEIKVLLFLSVCFLVGFAIKIIQSGSSPEYKEFDYSKQDSLFEFYTSRAEKNLELEKIKEENNPVDSKQEVLDFSPHKFEKTEIPSLPADSSININTADKETLMQLPGIGEKTAENIIELRRERGKFTSLEELIDAKGIGTSKFNKIKKFLYIEPSI